MDVNLWPPQHACAVHACTAVLETQAGETVSEEEGWLQEPRDLSSIPGTHRKIEDENPPQEVVL